MGRDLALSRLGTRTLLPGAPTSTMMNQSILNSARRVCVVAIGVMWAQPVLADSINLAWDPNSATVSGYAVYVGTQSGVYGQRYDVGPATGFTYPSATAGQQYCFTVAAYTATSESSKSSEVCGYSNQFPSLTNPGNQSSTTGQSVSLQLNGVDPDGQPLTYSSTGLPPGVSLMASTGYISGSGTTSGTYSVTVRAFDGVLTTPQSFTWAMAAGAPPPPPPDTTVPGVTITSPTTSSAYTTSSSMLSLGGGATDNVGVTGVTWVSDRGGSGTASGTANWSASIALVSGANSITVTARDAAGNVATDLLLVTYNVAAPPPPPPPPPAPAPTQPVVLSGQIDRWNKVKGFINLSWTSANWSSVAVYRNGTRVTSTTNDGAYTDSVRTRGTYTYTICNPSSSSVCSNTLTIFY